MRIVPLVLDSRFLCFCRKYQTFSCYHIFYCKLLISSFYGVILLHKKSLLVDVRINISLVFQPNREKLSTLERDGIIVDRDVCNLLFLCYKLFDKELISALIHKFLCGTASCIYDHMQELKDI